MDPKLDLEKNQVEKRDIKELDEKEACPVEDSYISCLMMKQRLWIQFETYVYSHTPISSTIAKESDIQLPSYSSMLITIQIEK